MTCGAAALAMYLDAVLPGDHGSPKHPLFFLFPDRWPRCCRRAMPKVNPRDGTYSLLAHRAEDVVFMRQGLACLLGSWLQRRRKVLLKKREWLPSPQHLRAWLRASLGW